MSPNSPEMYEVICIGAGPSNLSVAAALEDTDPITAARTLMLEANDTIAWQPGMLREGALSQVSYIKDLATLRDPTSRFTFVNYLHAVDRLDDFVNMGLSTPYREEISRYHQWAAEQFDHVQIRLSTRAVRVGPILKNNSIEGWTVETNRGDVFRAKHIVWGTGRDARIPLPLFDLKSDRVIHSTAFSSSIGEHSDLNPARIAVIGSAQSAAELFLACGSLFPDATRTMIMRSIGVNAYESSKFTNELFYASYVDKFHSMNEVDRRSVLAQMHRSNYSGLAPHTLQALYSEKYLADLHEKATVHFEPMTEIVGAAVEPDGAITMTLTSSYEGTFQKSFDLVLLGTGFDPQIPRLLSELASEVGLTEPIVDRFYRLVTTSSDDSGICFVQGTNELTHGIADSLLSVQAHRASEIARLITTHKTENTRRTNVYQEAL